MKWHDASQELPEVGIPVLVYIPKSSVLSCKYNVVCLDGFGITEEERKNLPESSKRKITYKSYDVFGNNKKPYRWEEYGPGGHFGQDIKFWAYLPGNGLNPPEELEEMLK